VRKRALASALAVAAFAVPASSAHGPGSGGSGYISTFADLKPAVPGIFVSVLGGAHQLQVANYSGKRVEVFADDIFKEARWVEIRQGTSFTWHERRIRWVGSSPPPVVQASPNEDHRIREWKVPGRIAGRPFLIEGFLGYRPSPAASASEGRSTWTIALAAVGGAALVVVALLGTRRLRRRAPSSHE
jgi:hypothetical protein